MNDKIVDKLINREGVVFIFVDLQEKLLRVISDKEALLNNTVKLARFAAILHLPVIVTEQQKLGETAPELKEALPKNEPFGKIHFDCFGEEDFQAKVGLQSKSTVVLCGIEAHICVAQTALTALAEGYRVHVVADASGSRAPHNKEIALQRLRRAGAVITSTEMVMYELLRTAGAPEFKSVLPLVK